MILLVWNSVVTADRSFRDGFPGRPPTTVEAPLDVQSSSPQILPESANPRKGPLTTRQKYLLGNQIDINTASKEEINSLPGISDTMAAAIVKEREASGGFRSPQDLTRVKGIKEKRLEKILPFLKKIPNN
jgi:competence ComEA-like helix-hairpin-helix protein